MFKKIILSLLTLFIASQWIPTFADDIPNSDEAFIWNNSNISEYISTVSNNTEVVPSINSRSAIVIERNSRKYIIWKK